MTEDEIDLLLWLAETDFSQYGECYGPTLDKLKQLGLVKIHGPETEMDNPFIAKGRGIMFRAVSLTDEGRRLAEKTKDAENE